MHHANGRRRRVLRIGTALGAAVALLVTGFVTGPVASGAPNRDIRQVEAQVRDLEMKAAAAHERHAEAANRLAQVQGELDRLRRKQQRERDQLTVVMSSVEDIARATYTGGGIDPSLQVLLAEDPSDFLAQAAALDQVAKAQSASLRQTQTARVRLAQSEAAIQDKEAIARKYRDQMAAADQEVADRLAEAEGVLADLQAAERERLRQLREQEEQQAASQAQTYLAGPVVAPNERAQIAVNYALSQVGKPYSMNASPPSSWDCSKLTAVAWAQAGVGLTALSFTQYDQTVRIPPSEIQPGDLVFYFGLGAHHVGMYIGGGRMVHAANPSDGVRIDDIYGPWYGERFSGVGRVVG